MQLLYQISSQLRNYVASTQQSSHSDAGMALAQGNSQNPAQPLSQASTASLYPGQITSSLLPAKGGVGLVHMPTQVQALQAKVVSRLLEPEQLAWKVFQNHHLGLAPQLQCLAYGASILFSTVSTQSLHLPARLNGYVTAFRALQPHRLLPVSAMHAEDVLNEPLFFNRQITMPINASAGCTAQKPLMPQEHTILLTAGITKVAHVQAALQLHQPQALIACLQTVLLAMPAAWQTVASSAPTPATWQQGLSAFLFFFFFFFGLQGRCSSSDGKAPTETPNAWFRAVGHCYWGCATGCACLDSTFPHVSFGHHALGDNSTISLIFAWHGNLARQVASPDVCMAALLRIYAFSTHMCHDMTGLS